MAQRSLFPVIIIRQSNGSIRVKANGWHYGYTSLCYSLSGSNIIHTIKLDTDEAVISDFAEGAGLYHLWLSNPHGKETVSVEFYYNRDSDIAIYKKILSYLYNLDDKTFAEELIHKIKLTDIGFTHQIIKEFSKIKSPTDFELESFYKLVTASERYENTMAISFNRGYANGLVCHYNADFSVAPPSSFTSVDLFVYNGGTPVYDHTEKITAGQIVHPLFTPNHYYRMDFFCGAEQVLSLIHYQLDEIGCAKLWEQESQNSDSSIDSEMFDDTELAHSGIDLTSEDKRRIIEERQFEPRTAFVERPIVTAENDPYILNVIIPDYGLIKTTSNTCYLSVVERDLYENGTFDRRIPIDAPTIKINSRDLMIDDEVIFCIKNNVGEPISKYTRYFLSYDYDDNISDFNEKRHQLELLEYTDQLTESFKNIFGNGNLYIAFSDIAIPLCKDPNKSIRETFDSILLGVAKNQRLAEKRDAILFFLEDNWMKLGNYDANFFKDKPVFYSAERRVTFPNTKTDYILCIERYDSFTDNVTRDYVSSNSSSGLSAKISDQVYCVYAIDLKNQQTSGRVLFCNFDKRNYYCDQIDMEVIVYNGQRS